MEQSMFLVTGACLGDEDIPCFYETLAQFTIQSFFPLQLL
jgi:hypothetical protein